LSARRGRRLRAVVDTSVLISADRHAIYLLARLRYFEAIWSPFIIGEMVRIRVEMAIRRDVDRAVYRERINRLIHLLSDVFRPVNYTRHTGAVMARDPDDEPILATALASRSGYIISNNTHHFPVGGEVIGVRFVTPSQFVEKIVANDVGTNVSQLTRDAGRQLP
jgi:predicted nucleic acid-binding protein